MKEKKKNKPSKDNKEVFFAIRTKKNARITTTVVFVLALALIVYIAISFS
ncbi:hypothetical protein QWY31_13280 [Cytophagales bacterium LB-30]|uniref:DUF4044 domain-containing protein n=1 Tax=Shiella aurantiaca TaxID=3058365 RepID=A0ABT8F939_9BACT|nr:hypothetical protein [Shiella aurantiaca]MDN4166476.1 hypothetical protein [Shiella aurantiaca]